MAGPVDAWMPLFGGEFLSDTSGWTNQERGAYVVLLWHLWRSGGAVAYDEAKLARVIGEPWKSFWSTAKSLFLVDNGALMSPALAKHRDRAVEVQRSLSDRNTKAVNARWAKDTSRNTSRIREGVRENTPSPLPTPLPLQSPSPSPTAELPPRVRKAPAVGEEDLARADRMRGEAVLHNASHAWAPAVFWAKRRIPYGNVIRLAREQDGVTNEMLDAVTSRWSEIPDHKRLWPERDPLKFRRDIPDLYAFLLRNIDQKSLAGPKRPYSPFGEVQP